MKTNIWYFSSIKVWVLCMAVLTASGCMVGPDYVRPQTTVPG